MGSLSLRLFLPLAIHVARSAAYVCGGDPGNGDIYCGADVCCKGDGSEVCYDFDDLNVYTGGCNPVVSGIISIDVFADPTTVSQIVATSYYVEYTTTVYNTEYSSGVETSYSSDVAYETTTLTITESGPTATVTERAIVKRVTTLTGTTTVEHDASTILVDYTYSSGYVSTVVLDTTLASVDTQVIGATSTDIVTETTTTTEDGVTVTVSSDGPTTPPTTVTVVSTPTSETQNPPSDRVTPVPQTVTTTPSTEPGVASTIAEDPSTIPENAPTTTANTGGPSVVTVTAGGQGAQASSASASPSSTTSANAAGLASGRIGGVVFGAMLIVAMLSVYL